MYVVYHKHHIQTTLHGTIFIVQQGVLHDEEDEYLVSNTSEWLCNNHMSIKVKLTVVRKSTCIIN